jgi:hypothetical protein
MSDFLISKITNDTVKQISTPPVYFTAAKNAVYYLQNIYKLN